MRQVKAVTTELDRMAAELRRLTVDLVRAMQFLEKGEVGCCGITLSQCHLLLEVARRGEKGVSPSEISPVLGLDLSTVSRIADGLVQQGLVLRDADPADRRRTLLSPSDKGRELAAAIDRNMQAYNRAVLEQLPPDKRRPVLESLELLVGALTGVKGGCCCE